MYRMKNGVKIPRQVRFLARNLVKNLKIIKLKMTIVRVEPILRAMQQNPDFPASDGSASQHLKLTLRGNKESILLLNRLIGVSELKAVPVRYYEDHSNEEVRLLELFNLHGSDKGTQHGYYFIYKNLFSRLTNPPVILEIGIGSNNLDIPSNMGRFASPGASLRAFRDFKPGATVFGADIDTQILNLDSDIVCHYLDQTEDKSWLELTKKVEPRSLDLLIDDGLHSPLANLRTLIYGQSLVKSKGFIVIEDIAEKALPLWSLVAFQLREQGNFTLYQCFKSYALVLEVF